MSDVPKYTDLMADIKLLTDTNEWLHHQVAALKEEVKFNEESLLQEARIIDELKAELSRARAEIRALKRQLLN